MTDTAVRYDPQRWNMANRHVEKYDRSRLVLRPGRTRRHRERIVLSFCAEGWLNNAGFPGEEICSSLFDYKGPDFRENYHTFHAGLHITWQIQRYEGRRRYGSYYCDAHLPDEYLELIREH